MHTGDAAIFEGATSTPVIHLSERSAANSELAREENERLRREDAERLSKACDADRTKLSSDGKIPVNDG